MVIASVFYIILQLLLFVQYDWDAISTLLSLLQFKI